MAGCTFAALRGQEACLAASRALVRLVGGTRMCRVGAHSRWQRPFDFPILLFRSGGTLHDRGRRLNPIGPDA
jgi:hypothetical protein